MKTYRITVCGMNFGTIEATSPYQARYLAVIELNRYEKVHLTDDVEAEEIVPTPKLSWREIMNLLNDDQKA